MAAGVKFTGGGKLLTKLKKMAKNSKKARLTAGFYKDAKYADGTPVAQVAAWNNFGTLREDGSEFIPPRPFFTDAINENKDKWAEGLGKRLKANGMDIENAMKRVGEEMRADIQDKIEHNNYVPNSPVTINGVYHKSKKTGKVFEIKGKGVNSPLRNTRHMRDSVGYQYNDESPQYRQGGD
ncbi:MAG: hypothetical protein KHX55_02495 [Proteobacteria bacterium]|nr:hypothetical protein [Pseudomonadota bacterium]